MSKEKLYVVKNDEGNYWDFKDYDGFYSPIVAGRILTNDQKEAKKVVRENGGHVVPLVEEPKKVVLSERQAKVIKYARSGKCPASNIAFSGNNDEELLINAYVHGYTLAKPKMYLVYKALGGKQKHEQFAQAYLSSVYPGTISWVLTNEVENGSFAKFTETEIEHYGLQDCEKKEVTDDDQ